MIYCWNVLIRSLGRELCETVLVHCMTAVVKLFVIRWSLRVSRYAVVQFQFL